MMRTIHKFQMPFTSGIAFIEMPQSANILKIGLQHGDITFWCEVDTDNKDKIGRGFQIIGTGWEIDMLEGYTAEYRETVFAGEFVWHIYELVEVK